MKFVGNNSLDFVIPITSTKYPISVGAVITFVERQPFELVASNLNAGRHGRLCLALWLFRHGIKCDDDQPEAQSH